VNHIRRTIHTVSISAIFLLCACESVPTRFSAMETGTAASISDAAHGEGAAGFYFLPPMVPAPTYSGVFVADVSPIVDICEWTGDECIPVQPAIRFAMDGGTGSESIRLDNEDEFYIVNWHTERYSLSSEKTYRIRVIVADRVLGYADVDVVESGKALKNVDTGEYVPLRNGRTIPIKFRIEEESLASRKTIFFISDESGTLNIWKGALTSEGIEDRQPITHYGTGNIYSFDIDESSEQLAYVYRPASSASGDLIVTDLDGSGSHLVPGLSARKASSAIWTPDQRLCVVEGSTGANSYAALSVAEIGTDGSGYVRFIHDTQPTGRRSHKFAGGYIGSGLIFGISIQFTIVRDTSEIYLRDANGIFTNLTRTAGNGERHPVLSPPGDQIAFMTTNYNGGREPEGISIMSSSGGPQLVLIEKSESYRAKPVQWLEDDTILYSLLDRQANTSYELYLMNADGTMIRNLTNTTSINERYAYIVDK